MAYSLDRISSDRFACAIATLLVALASFWHGEASFASESIDITTSHQQGDLPVHAPQGFRLMSAASTRSLTVSAEPAVLVGRVKLSRNDAYGWDVLIATATAEILVSKNVIAEQLLNLAGRLVIVKGRLVKKPDGERPTIVAREFEIFGNGTPFPPDDVGLDRGLRRVTANEKLGPHGTGCV